MLECWLPCWMSKLSWLLLTCSDMPPFLLLLLLLLPCRSTYSHGRTTLLAIQVDAAINSGNSGGPVILGDHVVSGCCLQEHGQHVLPAACRNMALVVLLPAACRNCL
jgi:hypothetical protein